MKTISKKKHSSAKADKKKLPDGAPAWITPELAQYTIRVWQPYYDARLTLDDAVIILSDVGRLFRVLSQDGAL